MGQDAIHGGQGCHPTLTKNSSAKQTQLLQSTIDKSDGTRVTKSKMITQCNTRFIERHTAVECRRALLLFTIESLEQIRNWQSPEARNAASALYNSIRQSDYIVGLVVLNKVSEYLLPLTRLLQTVGLWILIWRCMK